jgi:hypothetical protein
MTKTLGAIALLATLLAGVVGACGGSVSTPLSGGLREACYGNGTCVDRRWD